MAKIVKYEWSIGSWEARASLTYVPIDQTISGKRFSSDLPFGSSITEELPATMEDNGNGVYYARYSSNDQCAILRITEE